MPGVETPPFALQNASHGAQLFRLAAGAFIGASWPGTGASPLNGPASGSTFQQGSQRVAGNFGGVVGVNDFAITQNGTPNMTVNVAGGQIFIPGGSVANQGLYYGLSDATTNLTISAASASNPRIDTIIAFVEDAAISGSNNDWKLQVVTGTATAGATLSNLTGAGSLSAFPNCVVLGYVLVPTSATSIVTADILNSQPLLSPGFTGLSNRGTPSGRIFANGTVSVPNLSLTTLTNLGTTDFLLGGMTTNGSSSLTVPVAGIYLVSAGITFGASVTQVLIINKNGSEARRTGGGGVTTASLAEVIKLAAGDVLTIVAFQGSGSAATVQTGTNQTWLDATLISG